MKARVQHLAPLSRHVLELLGKLRSITGDSEYLFPLIRDPKRPLHGTALSCGLRSLGFNRNEVTPHGFRATACTLLNELGWRPDAIARQLAHGTANDVRRHYSYAQHLPEHLVAAYCTSGAGNLRVLATAPTASPLIQWASSALTLSPARGAGRSGNPRSAPEAQQPLP